MTLRDDFLVTMGARAAYMNMDNIITLPSGVEGERKLSEFVTKTIDEYEAIRHTEDVNFDSFIENALTNEYGPEYRTLTIADLRKTKVVNEQ